jgi:KDO2-lipid IV(A) lauroyltransferase
VARSAATGARDRLTYILFRSAVFLVPRLPLRFLHALGVIVGLIAYLANRGAREAVLRNLAVVFPEASVGSRRRLAQRTFVHGAWGYIELFALADLTPDEVRTRYHITGWENVDPALAAGHGIVMVTSHAGAPSAAGQAIALSGPPSTLVVEQLQPPALHQLVADLRGGFGVRVITVGRESLRQMIAALRRNELVGIASDRDVAGTGRELPFFGVTTRVSTAGATLALRTNATVLPAFAYRTGLLTGAGRIEPQVEMPRTGDAKEDIRVGTLRIMERIERFIREHPEQWAVFTDVWPRPARGPGVEYNADAVHGHETHQ